MRIRNGAEAYTDVEDTTKNEIERTGRTRRRRAWMCLRGVGVSGETMNVGKTFTLLILTSATSEASRMKIDRNELELHGSDSVVEI